MKTMATPNTGHVATSLRKATTLLDALIAPPKVSLLTPLAWIRAPGTGRALLSQYMWATCRIQIEGNSSRMRCRATVVVIEFVEEGGEIEYGGGSGNDQLSLNLIFNIVVNDQHQHAISLSFTIVNISLLFCQPALLSEPLP